MGATQKYGFGNIKGRAHEGTLDLHPQVNQIPFEPEHQFAASFNAVDKGVSVFVKGGTIFPVMELHKWSWKLRHRERI